MTNESINAFAAALKESRHTVFFGGAGVSTESGLKDYRSEDGLYHTVKQYGVSPETILSHTFFEQNPAVFYDFYYHFFLQPLAMPNAAHTVLAHWEQHGLLHAVITQNIDGLHQRAGSKRVLELHGTTAQHYCAGCGAPFPTEQVTFLKGSIPRCPHCGGIIRPAVVLYEEPLPEDTVEQAIDELTSADTLIIGGTSLAVYPAAAYLRYFHGRNLVLINRGETSYDNRATLLFRDPIGKVLGAVDKLL